MEVSDRSLPSCLRRLRRSDGLSAIFVEVHLRSIESVKVNQAPLSAICASKVPANQQPLRSLNQRINDDDESENR